jgi:ribonuclease P protein component
MAPYSIIDMIPIRSRLKRKKDIEFVLKNGRSFSYRGLLLKICENGLPQSRIGLIVGKKVAKTAVERNRIRRRIGEAVRKKLPFFKKSIDGIFIVRPPLKNDLLSSEEIITTLLRRAHVLENDI